MTKNKVLLISNVSAVVYIGFALYILLELFNGQADEWGALFATILALFLIPSIFLVFIGLIFGIFAYRKNNRWLTLTSTIFYLLGGLVVFTFGAFLIPTFGLSLTSFIMQVNQVNQAKKAAASLLP